jgi:peptidyl-dipeptidase Dcp
MEPNATVSADAQALLAPWPGPYGGLPPLAGASPAAIEDAMRAAIEMKRAEVQAIVSSTALPTFENTAEALEACGCALRRVQCVYQVHINSLSLGDMPAVARRIAPMLAALDDEIAHDERLYTRLNAVWDQCVQAGLSLEQQRLVEVLCKRLQRRGAGLAPAAKERLAAINGRLATLSSRYNQSLIEEAGAQAVFISDESGWTACPMRCAQPLRRPRPRRAGPASGPFPMRVARCGRF